MLREARPLRSDAWRSACSISIARCARARFELSDLFAVEGDAIFGAIEIEGGLAEQVLRLAKLGVEFVGARAQALLFGFEFVRRSAIRALRPRPFRGAGSQGAPLRYRGARPCWRARSRSRPRICSRSSA